MPRDDQNTQAPVRAITAIEDTKRGYGLWRGEVIHPDDPRMDEIVASGDPITDTKGFGLRYMPVRGAGRVAHFRAHDPEKLGQALDRAFPLVHDAVVRLVAEDIRAGGYDSLARWCAGGSLPGRFDVAEVSVEKWVSASGRRYVPDISVRHPASGRIELEVVNTHLPDGGRLAAAWGDGHVVLTLGIRGVVENIVFSEARGVVPDDAALRALLGLRKFRLCGGEDGAREHMATVWRDLDMAVYGEELAGRLVAARKRVDAFLEGVVGALDGRRVDNPATQLWTRALAPCPETLPALACQFNLLLSRDLSRSLAWQAWDQSCAAIDSLGMGGEREVAREFLSNFRLVEVANLSLREALQKLWAELRETDSFNKRARGWLKDAREAVETEAVNRWAVIFVRMHTEHLLRCAEAWLRHKSSENLSAYRDSDQKAENLRRWAAQYPHFSRAPDVWAEAFAAHDAAVKETKRAVWTALYPPEILRQLKRNDA
jgi:hypothetical protein